MAYRVISLSGLKNLKNNVNVLLIDVRKQEELKETGVIPGSINIPLDDLKNTFEKLSEEEFKNIYKRQKPSLATEIVFSCRSGKRSQVAIDIATSLGYTNCLHYPGGWLGWEEHLKNQI